MKITIDNLCVDAAEGRTILETANANNIFIPSLCHDDRVKAYGSCGICVVEAENNPRLLRACSTVVSDGMIIHTNTKRVRETRKTALELLLSDHTGDCRPPCVNACPGNTDCQGYVGLIANGEFAEAKKLIMEQLPFPSSIGRVCPHPCESECRRRYLEEPVNIAQLKRFAGDMVSGLEIPIKEPTGKTVSVIGGGPGGLTAAYFLRQCGHMVTVYDAMPQMGGLLRYGIPEYRLPKAVLDKEISVFSDMGIVFQNDIRIGADITLDELCSKSDAVVIASGAWKTIPLGCDGEDMNGVVSGIDLLRETAVDLNGMRLKYQGKRVCIVGGGNVAMDACRSLVRLGAKEVYVVYRRTRAEIPAEDIEVEEALEEGVDFKFLTNPIEIIGDNNMVSLIKLQKMTLGEPDASGRRAPVPIQGDEELLAVDAVVTAIGQSFDSKGFEAVTLTKRGTVAAGENDFTTNIQGVFAIGDATNKGAGIAISAIGEGKRAAEVIDRYLNGESIPYKPPYLSKTHMDEEAVRSKYAGKPKQKRLVITNLEPDERKSNFTEVSLGYDTESAVKEAKRCLECGCQDYYECKLLQYANLYAVKPEKFDGEKHDLPVDVSNQFMYRNPNKCILCGLCVRVCDETMGVCALGIVDRGFDAKVSPALSNSLAETNCISCGQCAALCPTGALGELLPITKSLPMAEEFVGSVCGFCGLGCKLQIAFKGNTLVRILPDKGNILCAKGRFGYSLFNKTERVTVPMIRKDGVLTEVSFDEAYHKINTELAAARQKYGDDAVAMSVSDRLTNEDAYVIKKYAESINAKIFCSNGIKNGASNVNTVTFDVFLSADLIIAIGDLEKTHTIAATKIVQRKRSDYKVKLITISDRTGYLDEYADASFGIGESLIALVEYLNTADKVVFVYAEKSLSKKAINFVDRICGVYGASVIGLAQNCNSRGLMELGINGSETLDDSIRAMLVIGEEIPERLSNIEFLTVMDLFMTETAEKADVVLPCASFTESCGSFTSAEGKVQRLERAVKPVWGLSNWQQFCELSKNTQTQLKFTNGMEIYGLWTESNRKHHASFGGKENGLVDKNESKTVDSVDKIVDKSIKLSKIGTELQNSTVDEDWFVEPKNTNTLYERFKQIKT